MNQILNYREVEEKIINWLRDYLNNSKCTGFVIGLSGGIDSSVSAILCRQVTKETVGLLLPCGHTPSDAIPDAKALAQQYDIEYRIYDLTPAYESILQSLKLQIESPITIPLANIKARLRMVALYYESNRLNRLVVGTGNRTELKLGFFTKYGDAGVDLLPIGGLLKREVRGLATHLGLSKHLISKVPSPGLWPGQTDEGELGATYDQLDDLVSGIIPQGLSKPEINKLKKRIATNAHKRKLAPICPI
ncbi:MAG: NAD(+) synthase [Candidatus Thorarchaeota archaeon]